MLDGWGWVIIGGAVLAAVAFITAILLVRKKETMKKPLVNNIENIIGQKCIVTERIDNNAGCGQARVEGLVWSARSAFDNVCFEEGEILQVLAVEGVKLICKK